MVLKVSQGSINSHTKKCYSKKVYMPDPKEGTLERHTPIAVVKYRPQFYG